MRLTRWWRGGGIALIAVLLFAVWVASWQPLEVVSNSDDGMSAVGARQFHASGVIHVHTTYSDGGGGIDDVVSAAAAAGLDFVIITDHNTFGGKPFEGYVDGVLVIVGTEVSTVTGHLLGFGVPTPTFRFSGDAGDALQDVHDLGGAAFVAHPTSPRPDFRWENWDLPGAWGIELLNGDTQWRSASWARAVWTTLLYPLNASYALLQLITPPTAMDRWDALLAERDVPGIAGSDSHSYIGLMEAVGLRFPSYRSVFELARNHVVLPRPLTGNADVDGRAIAAALANGRSYIALDALASAAGFFFVADDGARQWTMGDTVSPTPSLSLRAGGALPMTAQIALIKDGQPIATARGELVQRVTEPGVYRVAVAVPGWHAPWIVSNPIYVFDPQVAEQRRGRLEIPPPVLPTRIVRHLDRFDGQTTFAATGDPSTRVWAEIPDSGSGPRGTQAGLIGFWLGAPSAEYPSPYAALMSVGRRDLSDATGLLLSLRGDGMYRLLLQVRDRNLESRQGEGTEWWFASIKTSTEWRRVIVPFTRFRTTDPGTDGQLDLDQVESLVLLVDTGTVPPGTRGTIWFRDLDLY